MKISIRKGVGFGLTSGIVTTLGLIIGLTYGTHSVKVVLSGIAVIAIADALSDAFGVHVSEESENHHTKKEILESTLATFFAKLVFALSFIIPVLLLPLMLAVYVSIAWGLALIGLFSYFMPKKGRTKPYKAVVEHLLLAVAVVIVTYMVGHLLAAL